MGQKVSETNTVTVAPLSEAEIDRRLLVALEEFRIVQHRIDEFDKLAITIKSWSITLSAVAIGFGFLESQNVLFLLASLSALVFWYLEASHKTYQTALLNRSKELEPQLLKLQMYEGPLISEHFRRVLSLGVTLRKARIMLLYSNVHHPHSLIFLGGLVLFYWQKLVIFLPPIFK